MKCKFNYFSKIQKQNHHFWRGRYICLDKNCTNIFIVKIYFEENCKDIGIHPNDKFTFYQRSDTKIKFHCKLIFGEFIHKQKVVKNIVCSGLKRTKQAREILLKSVSLVQNENVLYNLINLGVNGKKA